MKRLAVSLGAAWCAACASAPPPAPPPILEQINNDLPMVAVDPPARGPVASRGVEARLPGEERPELFGSFEFDVRGLPLLEPLAVSSTSLSSFSIIGPGASAEMMVPIKDFAAQVVVNQVLYSNFRSGESVAGRGNYSPCTGKEPISTRNVEWEGIARAGWTEASLEYVRVSGTLSSSCQFTAKKAAHVRAKAIVPGMVYAFRECIGGCDPQGEESLVLLGPAAQWLASSAPWPSDQQRQQDGAFSSVKMPLARGGSASATLNANHASIRDFVGLRQALPESLVAQDSGQRLLATSRYVQFSVDATWGSEESAPTGVAFLASHSKGSREMLSAMGVKPAAY